MPGAGAGGVFGGQCFGAGVFRAGRHADADESQRVLPDRQPAAGRGFGLAFKQGGLGIANTVTSLVNVTLLGFALRQKLKTLNMASLRGPILQLVVLAVFAGAGAFAGWRWWEKSLGHETLALKIGAVFVPAGTAGLIYWLAALALKIPAAQELTEFALAKFVRR